MLQEIFEEINESNDIMKYLPRKLQKSVKETLKSMSDWIELMSYPESAGWYGFYGAKEGEHLEFTIKTYVDIDSDLEDFVKSRVGEDFGDIDSFIAQVMWDYFEIEREDLEKSLKSEFGLGDFKYAGRQGGYLLIGDWEDYIFKGTGNYEVNVSEEAISDVKFERDEIEELLMDIQKEGPLGENFEDYVDDLEEYIDGLPYSYDFEGVKKGSIKVIHKRYQELEKFIDKTVKNVEKGFSQYLKEYIEGNF